MGFSTDKQQDTILRNVIRQAKKTEDIPSLVARLEKGTQEKNVPDNQVRSLYFVLKETAETCDTVEEFIEIQTKNILGDRNP